MAGGFSSFFNMQLKITLQQAAGNALAIAVQGRAKTNCLCSMGRKNI
jgi:hypothetical protein